VGGGQKLCARLPAGITAFALAVSSVPGCFSSSPVRVEPNATVASAVSHTVQRGETIYHIARLYGVSPTRLMAANGLTDPHQLAAGQILVIPLERQAASPESPSLWPVARAQRQFAWPVTSGLVSSPFGIRNGVMHDGVDIVAQAGSPVHAADDGTVIFAGRLRGYGNAIILQHAGTYVTIYGHNQVNLVPYGAEVMRGQVIALLGSTGRASGPNLHFEVRFHGRPQNPLAYLPLHAPAGGISFARNGGS
jgi:murein DD-endopeptidase MepM/ murein hydrolase activator NlpD